MTISIDEFVDREVIYCVSSLIYTLTQQGKLDEDYWYLWEAVDWDAAKEDIKDTGASIIFQDDRYHICIDDISYYDALTEVDLIRAYFDDDLSDYEVEVLEHWLVTDWLGEKLKAKGETVEEDFYGLTIWGRCTSGMGIAYDSVIKEIYEELINS